LRGRATPAENATRPPNIILILSDDYGIPGVGCYGGAYKTPHLDELARTGMRFEHCYSMPLCGPSRACLLTGRYAFRTGVVDNGTGGRATPQKEITLAKLLQQAGYVTALAGKWSQLEYLSTPDEARAWGFDEFLRWVKARGERYWQPAYSKNGTMVEVTDKSYGPDLLHEFAVDFITRHKDRPFFLYYPTPLIHGPILRTPDSAPKSGDLYADNVAYLDKLVGKLAAELDRLQLREKTILAFTGDNGSTGKGRHLVGGRPIEGSKGTMKEGGSRVPLLVNWKGTTPAGKVCKDLVDFSDFFPTLAELAGAKLPGDRPIDGRSFAAQLKGEPGKPREWVYVQLGNARYVRDPAWKLYGDGTLCDLREAPFREIPVAPGGEGQDAAEARKRLQAVLDQLVGAQPAAEPPRERRAGKKKRAK
jgi:arylsulfatase A-like enzyme